MMWRPLPPSNEGPSRPHLPRSGEEAHPQLAGEQLGNWGAAAASPRLGANHLKTEAELPQQTLPGQLRGSAPPIILATV